MDIPYPEAHDVSSSSDNRIVITGANGHMGKKLIDALGDRPVRAIVRSNTARANLQEFIDARDLTQVDIVQCDYLDTATMAAATASCAYLVHLVGIIKESSGNSFPRAHQETTQVLVDAICQSGIQRVCYLSLLGADNASTNPCLASRGHAECQLLKAGTPALILQIPMVLGEGDYASRALQRKAMSRISFTFRGSSLEQPIYSGDVINAITTDIDRCLAGGNASDQLLALPGPHSLSRDALTKRAAKLLGRKTTIISLPLKLGLGIAWFLEQLSSSPPVSRAMLRVLDHDDNVDPLPACQQLAIELTSLDNMLQRTLL